MANEILDSADVVRELFGKGEGLTHETRDALPQRVNEASPQQAAGYHREDHFL